MGGTTAQCRGRPAWRLPHKLCDMTRSWGSARGMTGAGNIRAQHCEVQPKARMVGEGASRGHWARGTMRAGNISSHHCVAQPKTRMVGVLPHDTELGGMGHESGTTTQCSPRPAWWVTGHHEGRKHHGGTGHDRGARPYGATLHRAAAACLQQHSSHATPLERSTHIVALCLPSSSLHCRGPLHHSLSWRSSTHTQTLTRPSRLCLFPPSAVQTGERDCRPAAAAAAQRKLLRTGQGG